MIAKRMDVQTKFIEQCLIAFADKIMLNDAKVSRYHHKIASICQSFWPNGAWVKMEKQHIRGNKKATKGKNKNKNKNNQYKRYIANVYVRFLGLKRERATKKSMQTCKNICKYV